MADPRWLNPQQATAWRAYRRMFLLLNAQIARDLAREGLSEADYDVLSTLTETDDRARLKDLSAHLLWSQSRLSHHITRMQQRGLVHREECPGDARGAIVVLTDAGRDAIEAAAPGHVESVREHFIDLLTPAQIRQLGEIAQTVVEHLSGAATATTQKRATGRAAPPAR
jgi:DNA-binding MarR family transcriptional regulator